MMNEYSHEENSFLKELRCSNISWKETARQFNEKFTARKTSEALRKHYYFLQELDSIGEDKHQLDLIKSDYRQKQSSSKVRKTNKLLASHMNLYDDAIDGLTKLIYENIKQQGLVGKRKKPSKRKKHMTIEALISDLHTGLCTDNFNLEIATKRVKEFCEVIIQEISNWELQYNIDRIVLACLGDLIHSESMHGLESARSVSMGNPEQIYEATKLLFNYLIEPLALIGIPITFVGVAGNHDRTELAKTYVSTGKYSTTWVIYNTIKELSKAKGYNVSCNIAENKYTTESIYGNIVLYEHGDEKATPLKLLEQRSRQIGELINYLRIGHLHSYSMTGRGQIIINGAICGSDGYSDGKGYSSEVTQTINTYIKSDKRKTSFYQSFPVFLN